jgi:hypothetical protein
MSSSEENSKQNKHLLELVEFCENMSYNNHQSTVINEQYNKRCIGRKHPELHIGHICPGCRGSEIHGKWEYDK